MLPVESRCKEKPLYTNGVDACLYAFVTPALVADELSVSRCLDALKESALPYTGIEIVGLAALRLLLKLYIVLTLGKVDSVSVFRRLINFIDESLRSRDWAASAGSCRIVFIPLHPDGLFGESKL
jgi:hypothetical protein